MALVKCNECGAQMSTEAKSCPSCGAIPKKKTSFLTWVVAGAFGLWAFSSFTSGRLSLDASTPAEPSPKQVALKAAELKFEWQKAGFDNIMQGDFTVSNNGKLSIKDITIECTHYAKSGTRIDSSKRTIFDVVEPGKTKTFKKFNMGFINTQAESTNCAIADLKVG